MSSLMDWMRGKTLLVAVLAVGLLAGGRAFADPQAHVLYDDGNNSYTPQAAGSDAKCKVDDDGKTECQESDDQDHEDDKDSHHDGDNEDE